MKKLTIKGKILLLVSLLVAMLGQLHMIMDGELTSPIQPHYIHATNSKIKLEYIKVAKGESYYQLQFQTDKGYFTVNCLPNYARLCEQESGTEFIAHNVSLVVIKPSKNAALLSQGEFYLHNQKFDTIEVSQSQISEYIKKFNRKENRLFLLLIVGLVAVGSAFLLVLFKRDWIREKFNSGSLKG